MTILSNPAAPIWRFSDLVENGGVRTTESIVDRDFNYDILGDVAHRPWPLPERPWIMTQTWRDLLFAHWPVNPALLQPRIPPALELDLFNSHAWLSVVPFRMTNVAPRGVPSLPGMSEFPELNVRTYVRAGAYPGVVFFSLDAGSALAVRAARLWLNLPYHLAAMRAIRRAEKVEYESHRTRGPVSARFVAVYEPIGPAFDPSEGSLEYFLAERYCLYHVDRRGVPYRMDIHHPKWSLRPARALITHNAVAEANALTLPEAEPLLHFVDRQDVVAWMPTPLG